MVQRSIRKQANSDGPPTEHYYANAKLSRGDHIAGIFRSGGPPRLVYAMEVSDVFDYDDYYHDRRFDQKKPRRDRTWRERAGNNIYFLDSSAMPICSIWPRWWPSSSEGEKSRDRKRSGSRKQHWQTVVNSDPDGVDHGLKDRPMLAFALGYVAAHLALDLLDERQADAILTYCEGHLNELETGA